ncbi:MAG TPA: carbon-nitrogen hydrolase family protein [Bryobacteraceae bacterium]|nr:carbon-nitrogen hydrolase family protein [Bryobacteraceae bacterium]
MKALAVLMVWAAAGMAEVRMGHAGFDATPSEWVAWSPRAEIAPRTFQDAMHYRTRPPSLAISGNSNAAVFGGWECTVPGIQAGGWYRFTAWYRAEAVGYEPLQVVSRLDWAREGGKRAGQPDYVWSATRQGEWTRVTLDAPAPPEAAAVKVQLYLQNAPHATVWWDDVSLEKIAAPGPREVRVAAVNARPGKRGTTADSVTHFLKVIEQAVPEKTDVIVLPEGITVVDTGKKYAEVAEPVPGPTTTILGEVARRRKSYIAAGIYEREGQAVYNTAVLIDREGRVAGKYRKVYIPREELEDGITPGADYPVFLTDFGKVGMMICWDLQYADPARALAMRGAEIILLPIWGGNETLGKARAIENQVFVASSGYDYPTYVMDPDGQIMALAKDRGQAAVATIDLNRRYTDKWLGNMRARFMKELRLDLRP